MCVKRWRVLLAVIALLLGTSPTVAAAGSFESTQDPIDEYADSPDGAAYADVYGVPVDVARERLEIQANVGQLADELGRSMPDEFAGLWIEHEPEYRVIVATTNDSAFDAESRLAGTPLAAVTDVVTVERSLAELEADALAILDFPGKRPFDLRIDVRSNRIELQVSSQAEFNDWMTSRSVKLADGVRVVEVPALSQPSANIYGGIGMDPICTTGFTVFKPSTGKFGVTTAAHCGNQRSVLGISLNFKKEKFGGSQDVQWHSKNSQTFQPWVTDPYFDSTPYYRVISGTIPRSQQPLGFFTCKYGATTYYTCGTVEDRQFAPGWIPNANPNFMRFAIPTDDEFLCLSGDSGGAVYANDDAVGVIVGSTGTATYTNCLYEAINKVENGLNVQVVTG